MKEKPKTKTKKKRKEENEPLTTFITSTMTSYKTRTIKELLNEIQELKRQLFNFDIYIKFF